MLEKNMLDSIFSRDFIKNFALALRLSPFSSQLISETRKLSVFFFFLLPVGKSACPLLCGRKDRTTHAPRVTYIDLLNRKKERGEYKLHQFWQRCQIGALKKGEKEKKRICGMMMRTRRTSIFQHYRDSFHSRRRLVLSINSFDVCFFSFLLHRGCLLNFPLLFSLFLLTTPARHVLFV